MADGSRRQRRVLHTSDLHLTWMSDTACHSLKAVVDLAIKTRVDLVIVAGDFFESSRVDDNLVGFAVEQLRRLSVPVVILPGNHDCLVPGSAYDRVELWRDATNVQIFRAPRGEIFVFSELGVSVWGKPNISYDDMRPLAGIPPPQGNGQWHIAVAHGYYVGDGSPLFPSYHITQEEIVASAWDYIALGHLVPFGCVCDGAVKAYYSGSPSMFGTAAIVTLAEGTGVQVTRYSL